MATTPIPNARAVSNYLVPANGGCRCMDFKQNFTTPLNIDWTQQGIDALTFNPSGFFVNNGAGILTIHINELNFDIVIPANKQMSMQYPAPVGHTLTISGSNTASIVFCDFPIIPFVQP